MKIKKFKKYQMKYMLNFMTINMIFDHFDFKRNINYY